MSASITNTGKIGGYEAAQLYVALGNGEPPKVLRGFNRIHVEPGESKHFEAQLMRRDLSTWDTDSQNWVICSEVEIFVGASSRNLPLRRVVHV